MIMNKNKSNISGIVYSTNPQFQLHAQEQDAAIIQLDKQLLKIFLDKKQRAGKSVTLVTGFQGSVTDLEMLGKKLKAFCGTGGSVKNNEVIIQGDNREKIFQWLHKNGYILSKKI